MKAFTISRYSKKDKLQWSDVALPEVKEYDVLVQVNAAGVNSLDSLIKNGDFKLFLSYKLPLTLGHDVAGIVTKVGSQVSKFKVGDAVYARPSDYSIGSFAEFISFNENDAALKPKKITMEEAASLPLVGLTAWQSLIEIAKLKSGQKVFIQAGSGGVGTFAIQLAKHIGAFVATTTSDVNIALVKSLGADLVINYKKEDFSLKLKDYDVVLHSNRDPKVLEQSLRILKPGGHLISLVGPPTPEFAQKLGLAWYLKLITKLLSSRVKKKAKRLGVNYSFLFMRADGKQLNEIRSLVEAEKIRPVVDKIYSFDKTNDALSYVESGRAKGKVVVKVS
jgi:NADPH:quinone reductase-like Zn-dependent oxidoreductase